MKTRPGRNSPCPCGSGKKYKKCCGKNAAPDPLLPEDEQTGTPLDHYLEIFRLVAMYYQKIVQFDPEGPIIEKTVKDAIKRHKPGRPGGLQDSFFLSWMNFDFRFGKTGQTVVERVLEEPRLAGLSEPGPTLLMHLAESYITFYQVVESDPERTVLEELGTGECFTAFFIRDLFEHAPAPGEVWLTRLVGPQDEALSYTTPYIYPADSRVQFERLAKARAEEFSLDSRSASVVPERLFAESQKDSAQFWAEYILLSERGRQGALPEIPPAESSLRLPQMTNTDGHPLLFTTMRFRILDEPVFRRRLAGLKTFIHDKDANYWTWLKGPGRHDPEAPRTQLASFRIEDGCLIAETNSRERADRLEDKLNSLFYGLLELRESSYRHLEDLPRPSPEEWESMRREDEEFNARPEVKEAMRKEMERRYFKEWPRRKIPALGGLTPLQAAETEEGREKLRALLAFYDRRRKRARSPISELDTDAIRRILGLLPRVN